MSVYHLLGGADLFRTRKDEPTAGHPLAPDTSFDRGFSVHEPGHFDDETNLHVCEATEAAPIRLLEHATLKCDSESKFKLSRDAS